jgi:UBA-like domain
MSRHRGVKNLIEYDDEYEDFDPMDDDESSEDYYISQVIKKTGFISKNKIRKALESTDWDVNAAINLINVSKSVPNKPNQPPNPSSQPKKQQAKPTQSKPQELPSPQPVQLKSSPPQAVTATPTPKLVAEETKKAQGLNQDYPDINTEV